MARIQRPDHEIANWYVDSRPVSQVIRALSDEQAPKQQPDHPGATLMTMPA